MHPAHFRILTERWIPKFDGLGCNLGLCTGSSIEVWEGFWSIPRNLELKTYKEGVRLVQKPVEQLQTLRHKLHR